VQDVDLVQAKRVAGGNRRVKAAVARWAERHDQLVRAAASGDLEGGAEDRSALNAFCNEHKMPVVLAEQPLGELGVVSEVFGDELAAFVAERCMRRSKDRDFQTAMFLRYARHACGSVRLAREEMYT
jgi:hypothetical protein